MAIHSPLPRHCKPLGVTIQSTPTPSLRAVRRGNPVYPAPVIASRRRGTPVKKIIKLILLGFPPMDHHVAFAPRDDAFHVIASVAWQSSLKNNKPILQGSPPMDHHVAFAPRDDEKEERSSCHNNSLAILPHTPSPSLRGNLLPWQSSIPRPSLRDR